LVLGWTHAPPEWGNGSRLPPFSPASQVKTEQTSTHRTAPCPEAGAPANDAEIEPAFRSALERRPPARRGHASGRLSASSCRGRISRRYPSRKRALLNGH